MMAVVVAELRSSINNMTPPGDLRNVLVALSDMPQLYEDIFQYRFDKSIVILPIMQSVI